MILQVYQGKNVSGHIGNPATDISPAKKEAMSGHKVSDTATGKGRGTGRATKTEKFQMAFDPPIHICKIMLQFFWKMSEKISIYKSPKCAT